MSSSEPQSVNLKYAWREVPREGAGKRSATERLADFLEIHGTLDEATAREQASRCIQCPEPECVVGCPLSNRIPEWLALTAEGQFLEAAALLHSTSSLPEICARVCSADRMCEGKCVLGGKSEPVSIWAVEQFLNDYALAHEVTSGDPAPPNGFRVAVIGSGPGGLACADVLSREGYAVTVFDWRLVPGGLLVNGAPSFRLDRSVLGRRIEALKRRGVAFQLGVKLGEDLIHTDLLNRFDAVYLAFGARKTRELDIPGSDLQGVAQALSFLAQPAAGNPEASPPIQVQDRRVVVLGGGEMAIDCVRTALRSGAKEVVGVYRRDEAQMTCSQADYQNAIEEGAAFEFLALPVAILGDAQGQVTGLRLVRTEPGPPEPDGRRSFVVRPGTEFELAADWVLTALGFEPMPLPTDSLFGGLARGGQGGLLVDDRQMTRQPGVFAGGELVRGPSSILEVVRDARRAAEGIHNYLQPRAA